MRVRPTRRRELHPVARMRTRNSAVCPPYWLGRHCRVLRRRKVRMRGQTRPKREGLPPRGPSLRPGQSLILQSANPRSSLGFDPLRPLRASGIRREGQFRLRKQELRWHPSAAIPPRDRPTVREPPLPSLRRQSRPGIEGSRFLFLIVIPADAGIQGICLFAFYPCSLPLREVMKRHNIFTLSGSGSRHPPE